MYNVATLTTGNLGQNFFLCSVKKKEVVRFSGTILLLIFPFIQHTGTYFIEPEHTTFQLLQQKAKTELIAFSAKLFS